MNCLLLLLLLLCFTCFDALKSLKSIPSFSARFSATTNIPIANELVGVWNDDFQRNEFLQKYWQRQPVLIRQAFDVKAAIPVGLEDLQTLSCDEDVESRIISYRTKKQKKDYGPFDTEYYESLKQSKAPWTLLVQEVDRHIPRLADLWQSVCTNSY